jgi:simple sugar transport system permease protein
MSIEVVLNSIFSALFLASVIRISTPLILPALGGLVSDLSGAPNIALEGMMLAGALAGVLVSSYTHSVALGVLAGMLAGLVISMVLAYFHLVLKTDPILAGVAINILCSGGTIFVLYVLTGDKGNSASLMSGAVPNVPIPILKDIPVLGTILSGHNILTYLAFIFAGLVSLMLYRTRFGAHLRAVGENAVAASSVGINVIRTRVIALAISGVLAGLGGINMSMGYLTLFQRDMTAGRGFIALAAVHLGGRTPFGTVLAAVFFGFADALSNMLGSLKIPSQLVQIIPYVATIIALVLYNVRRQSQIIDRARKFQEKHLAEMAAIQAKQ